MHFQQLYWLSLNIATVYILRIFTRDMIINKALSRCSKQCKEEDAYLGFSNLNLDV